MNRRSFLKLLSAVPAIAAIPAVSSRQPVDFYYGDMGDSRLTPEEIEQRRAIMDFDADRS